MAQDRKRTVFVSKSNMLILVFWQMRLIINFVLTWHFFSVTKSFRNIINLDGNLGDKIEALLLAYRQNPYHVIDYYSARIAPENIQVTLAKLKAVMIKNDENEPFEYHFLDEQIALFYVEDQRRQTILIWVTFATIFIACLGLFGLATYAANQRVKEIGVRKVLGASVFNLTSLLSKDFLKLVLIANVVAIPIGWWATTQWLQEYAYHIHVKWWIFVLAGLLAIVIALTTVSYQAIKAALANPVKSLRTE